MGLKLNHMVGIAVIVAILIAFYLSLNMYVVGAHEVGIVIDDGVIEGVIGPGWHVTEPLEKIVMIPTAPQKSQATSLSMATKDNFSMTESIITYIYAIPPDKALTLYRKNPNYVSQLRILIAQAAKNTIGQFKLISIPRNRVVIEKKICSKVNEYLESHVGISNMVKNVVLKYYGWERRARQYLSSVQKTKQQIRLAKLEKRRDKISRKNKIAQTAMKAKNKIVMAKAEKKARVLRARADAKAERIRNEVFLDKLRTMVEMVGPEGAVKLVRWRNWNGQMPEIVGRVPSIKLERTAQLN